MRRQTTLFGSLSLLALVGCAAAPPGTPTQSTNATAQSTRPAAPAPEAGTSAAPFAVAPASGPPTASVPVEPAIAAPTPSATAGATTPATVNGKAPTPATKAATPVANSKPKLAVPAKPAAIAPATPAANATPKPGAPPALDLAALEQRLRDTKAIGLFTKLSIKNQVDDLMDSFRDHFKSQSNPTLTALRQRYDLLLMKVLTLLQDGDPPLASAINASREAIWNLLNDPTKLAAS